MPYIYTFCSNLSESLPRSVIFWAIMRILELYESAPLSRRDLDVAYFAGTLEGVELRQFAPIGAFAMPRQQQDPVIYTKLRRKSLGFLGQHGIDEEASERCGVEEKVSWASPRSTLSF